MIQTKPVVNAYGSNCISVPWSIKKTKGNMIIRPNLFFFIRLALIGYHRVTPCTRSYLFIFQERGPFPFLNIFTSFHCLISRCHSSEALSASSKAIDGERMYRCTDGRKKIHFAFYRSFSTLGPLLNDIHTRLSSAQWYHRYAGTNGDLSEFLAAHLFA